MATDEAKLIVRFEAENKKLHAELNRTTKRLDRFEKKAKKNVRGVALGFKSILGGIALGALTRATTRYSDAYTNLSNRLRLATNSQEEFNRAQDTVFKIAQETRQSLGATAELYQRLALSTKQLGLNQADLEGIVRTVNQSLVISGSTAAGAEAAIIQLGQGLAAGALRGEEFNSVAEQAPRLLQVLSDALGKNIGELRELAKEGGLTADVVAKAIQGQSEIIAKEFSTTTQTVSQGVVKIQNALTRLVGSELEASGAGQELTKSINEFVDLLQDPAVVEGIGSFASLIVKSMSAATKAVTGFVNVVKGLKETAARITAGAADIGDAIKDLSQLQSLGANLGNFNISARVDRNINLIEGLIGFSSVEELRAYLDQVNTAVDNALVDISEGRRVESNKEFLQFYQEIIEKIEEAIAARKDFQKPTESTTDAPLPDSIIACPTIDEEALKEQNAQLSQVKNLLESIRPPLKEYSDSVAVLDSLLAAGKINQVDYNNALSEYQRRLEEATGANDAWLQAVDDSESILKANTTELEELDKALARVQELFKLGLVSPELLEREKERIAEVKQELSGFSDVEESLKSDLQKLTESFNKSQQIILEGTRDNELKRQELLTKLQTEFNEDLLKLDKDRYDAMTIFAEEAARNIQDKLGDTLRQSMDGSFDGILDSWADMLKDMVAQAAAAQLNRALFGEGFSTGQSSNIGGLIGKGLGLLGFGNAKAEGGPVNSGTTYLVGEAGPELFTPSGMGNIVPNDQLGGTTVNFGDIVLPGIKNDQDARRAAGTIKREVANVVRSSQRYT